MKRIVILTLIFFLFLPIIYSQPEILCSGEDCYKNTYKIEETIINTKLNRDGSVYYSQIIGLKYNFPGEPSGDIMLPEFLLPIGSEIDPEIHVTELFSNKKFESRYEFKDYCEDLFIFNRNKNSIILCLKPTRQIKIKIDTTILPIMNRSTFDYCGEKTNIISNFISIPYISTGYEYFMTATTEGGEGVKMEKIDPTTCTDVENLSFKISDFNSYPRINGMLCQGKVLPIPSNGTVFFNLKLGGVDQTKLVEREQEEMKNLQKLNINASIMASNSTNIIKYSSIASAFFTLALVVVTILYVKTAQNTLKENKKVSEKRDKDDLIYYNYEPLHYEISQIIINLKERVVHNILKISKWESLSNTPRLFVEMDKNFKMNLIIFITTLKIIITN